MKLHTAQFKNAIKNNGRELKSKLTVNLITELGDDDLNSVTPMFQGNILKSVMKELELDSNVYIAKDSVVNYQFGVKTHDAEGNDDGFEYLDFGNYIVAKEPEKQEDLRSYKIICYDSMINTMKDYESLQHGTFPMTVRDYINNICLDCNLFFANSATTFVNYNKVIPYDLYEGLGYTYRDILDELAQVTASTICINESSGMLEIRYISDSQETINEEFLKDVNVNFGEQYGTVNTIVLSRSAGADKISQSFPEDLPDDEKIAIEIADNQILNFNNRDEYIPEILNKLYGLQYYVNDFESTGIAFLELCDRYTISIGEQNYSCVMFNDEINITQGISESVNTEMPEESETDYSKTDKTDRRINQTYLIVDKQNQVIESVVSNVDEQNTKISQITQTVDELNSKISDIADLTTSGETTIARLSLQGINESEPITLQIHPITQNISYLYPHSNLYPSDNLYMTSRTVRFHNDTTSEDFDLELPDDLLYYDENTYDEFILDYGDGETTKIFQVIKRCKYNADGTVGVLSEAITRDYTYITLNLTAGDYIVSLLGYGTGYIFARLMSQNIYTTQFYTKVETNSQINQKADEINLGVTQTLSNYSTTNQMNAAINIKANEINQTVSQKVGKSEIISSINQTPETITINASKVNLQGYVTFSNLSTNGQTSINGANIQTGTLSASQITTGTLSADRISGGTLQGSSVIATSGRIGGWTLEQNALSAENGNHKVILTNITNSNQDFIVVKNGNNYPFWVRGDGTLYAGNATINGTVYADAGIFNNVTINGSPINSSSINHSSYKYAGGSETVLINDGNDGMIEGYYTNSGNTNWNNRRYAIVAFNNGGRFQTFDGNGNMAAYFNQTGSHTSSDIRYKKHVKNITEKESIDIIKNLTPIEYDYDTEEKHRGLSAQEVEKVLLKNGYKNQVYNIEKDGKYTLNYTELIPDLINCIKYLNNKIEKIERESDK